MKFLVKILLKFLLKHQVNLVGKSIVGKNGVTLGLSTFGKSAPYKDIYKLFNLTSDEIVKIVKEKVKK